jgi:hypothetical protein
MTDDARAQAAQEEATRPTFPESARALRYQLQALERGDKPAVELASSRAADVQTPQGERFRTLTLPSGNHLVYDRAQLETQATRRGVPASELDGWVLQEARAGRLGRILGYGIDAKPTPGTPTSLVQVQDSDGREVLSVGARPDEVDVVVRAVERVTPPGGRLVVAGPDEFPAAMAATLTERAQEAGGWDALDFGMSATRAFMGGAAPAPVRPSRVSDVFGSGDGTT